MAFPTYPIDMCIFLNINRKESLVVSWAPIPIDGRFINKTIIRSAKYFGAFSKTLKLKVKVSKPSLLHISSTSFCLHLHLQCLTLYWRNQPILLSIINGCPESTEERILKIPNKRRIFLPKKYIATCVCLLTAVSFQMIL